MKAWPWRETEAANTPTWQLVIWQAEPVYCRATPHDALLQKTGLVDNHNRILIGPMLDDTIARSASACQRPRPRIACWRHGPGSPRDKPVG
jgi:hypothetical protein